MNCDIVQSTDLYNALSVIPGDRHPAPLPVRNTPETLNLIILVLRFY